jgi:multimeric flavodoxin WrbA
MDILSLHLSPNKGGNSDVMLDAFNEGAAEPGLEILKFSVAERRVEPCRGCGSCDQSGQCVIVDDLEELYPLLAEARNIVVSTSLYFYDVPAKGKALIDRSQALWVRRYVLNRKEALKPDGRGFLLALGATRGENLFIPVSLSIRYFFDALGLPKTFETLFFRGLEKPGDLARQPDLVARLREAGRAFGRRILSDRAGRK